MSISSSTPAKFTRCSARTAPASPTLIKIMTGAVKRDLGKMLLDGAPVDMDSPAEAHALGISTVYQEVNLIPTLSVTKNSDTRAPAQTLWPHFMAQRQ